MSALAVRSKHEGDERDGEGLVEFSECCQLWQFSLGCVPPSPSFAASYLGGSERPT
jgi:hypothetical protein